MKYMLFHQPTALRDGVFTAYSFATLAISTLGNGLRNRKCYRALHRVRSSKSITASLKQTARNQLG